MGDWAARDLDTIAELRYDIGGLLTPVSTIVSVMSPANKWGYIHERYTHIMKSSRATYQSSSVVPYSCVVSAAGYELYWVGGGCRIRDNKYVVDPVTLRPGGTVTLAATAGFTTLGGSTPKVDIDTIDISVPSIYLGVYEINFSYFLRHYTTLVWGTYSVWGVDEETGDPGWETLAVEVGDPNWVAEVGGGPWEQTMGVIPINSPGIAGVPAVYPAFVGWLAGYYYNSTTGYYHPVHIQYNHNYLAPPQGLLQVDAPPLNIYFSFLLSMNNGEVASNVTDVVENISGGAVYYHNKQCNDRIVFSSYEGVKTKVVVGINAGGSYLEFVVEESSSTIPFDLAATNFPFYLKNGSVDYFLCNDQQLAFENGEVIIAFNDYKTQYSNILTAYGNQNIAHAIKPSYYIDFILKPSAIKYAGEVVADVDFYFPGINKYNTLISAYETLKLQENTSIIIEPVYSLVGTYQPYTINAGVFTCNSIKQDTYYGKDIDRYIGILLPPLTKKLSAIDPLWAGTYLDISYNSVYCIPTTFIVEGATYSSNGTVLFIEPTAGEECVFTGEYAWKNRTHTIHTGVGHDPLWDVTGPNGTIITDLPEWGEFTEGNYQFSEHAKFNFSLVAPRACTVTLQIEYFASGFEASSTNIKQTVSYDFAVVIGANNISIDLLLPTIGVTPLDHKKMHRVENIKFLFPSVVAGDIWALDSGSFYLSSAEQGSYMSCWVNVPSFSPRCEGKDALEILRLYAGGQTYRYYKDYYISERKIINSSLISFVDTIATQSGWSAGYVSPFISAENTDALDMQLCSTLRTNDLVVGQGNDVKIAPHVNGYAPVPLVHYTFNVCSTMYGGIAGVLYEEATKERVISTVDAVHLYMWEVGNEGILYTYVASASTDVYGVFTFESLLPSRPSLYTGYAKQRFYGLSTVLYAEVTDNSLLSLYNILVHPLQYTTCIVAQPGEYVPPTIGFMNMAHAQNRFGLSHTFYVKDMILYRKTFVNGGSVSHDAPVISFIEWWGGEDPPTNISPCLWACYHGNSLMVGGHIEDGYDFILKSDDEGTTWKDIPHWESLYYPSEG